MISLLPWWAMAAADGDVDGIGDQGGAAAVQAGTGAAEGSDATTMATRRSEGGSSGDSGGAAATSSILATPRPPSSRGARDPAEVLSLEEWVPRMKGLLDLEREAEIAEAAEATRLPGKELQAKGVCLLSLVVHDVTSGLYGRSVVELRARDAGPLPANRFSPGDIVGLCDSKSGGVAGGSVGGAGGARSGAGKPIEHVITGVVARSRDKALMIAVDDETSDLDAMPNSVRVDLLANNATFRRLNEGLDRLVRRDVAPASHLIDILFGSEEPRFVPPSRIKFTPFNGSLNESQLAAVKMALSTRDVSLIHGPPGTGKTTTVVEVIRQAVARGDRVLACAPSNVAVDNLVERLAVRLPHSAPKIVRVGHPARVTQTVLSYCLDARIQASSGTDIVKDVRQEMSNLLKKIAGTRDRVVRRTLRQEQKALRREIRQREDRVVREIIRGADVVLCTLTGAASRVIRQSMAYLASGSTEEPSLQFDVTVIDEVAQATEASCWIALSQAPTAILAGDHRQLPPTITSEDAARGGLDITLADRVDARFRDSAVALLTIQYRMHRDIMTWSSEAMYEGRLTADESVAGHTLADLDGVTADETTHSRLVLIDTRGCNFDEKQDATTLSKANPEEAEITNTYVRNLVAAGVRPVDIAVISPYNAQVGLLRSLLLEDFPRMEIRSVDGFQGQEKEAVVMSLVRSNASHEVGFLRDSRRMNVAVTRARRHVAIVCDSQTVSCDPFLASLLDFIEASGEVWPADMFLSGFGGGDAALESDDRLAVARERLVDSSANRSRHDSEVLAKQKQRAREAARRTEVKQALKKRIDAHFATGEASVLQFEPSMNGFQRMLVHEIAEEEGLNHNSYGEGKDRYVVVSKGAGSSAPPVAAADAAASGAEVAKNGSSTPDGAPKAHEAATEERKGTEDTAAASLSVEPPPPKAAQDSPTSTADKAGTGSASRVGAPPLPSATADTMWWEKQQGQSDASQAGANSLLKQLAAERAARADKGGSAASGGAGAGGASKSSGKSKKKRQKQKKKAKGGSTATAAASHGGLASGSMETALNAAKTASGGVDELAMLDALLTESQKCRMKGCKAKTTTVGSVCRICHEKFCYDHGQPEVHGCGSEARRAARAAHASSAPTSSSAVIEKRDTR